MSQHAQRIIDERKQKADDAAKLAFAEAIEAASEYPDAGFNAMRRQYLQQYNEPYSRILNERKLER
jgi:hypothetical protein